MTYYIIPIEKVEEINGLQNGINILKTRKDKLNRNLLNVNCGEDLFKEINWNDFEKIELSIDDFENEVNF